MVLQRNEPITNCWKIWDNSGISSRGRLPASAGLVEKSYYDIVSGAMLTNTVMLVTDSMWARMGRRILGDGGKHDLKRSEFAMCFPLCFECNGR